MKKTKAQKGITLIVLIVTIIVLLILAVVSIRTIQGDGIIAKARQAASEYGTKQDEEKDMLSQYELMIAEQTGKAWVQNGTGEGTTFTKGEQKVKLGDVVNYDHTKDETGATITGANASYTSPAAKSGYTSDQIFTLSSYSGGWKVIGVKNGQLRLVSTANIVPTAKVGYCLKGKIGYQNGVEELEKICAIYGYGNGADNAESIKAEDINRITGFDPTTYSKYGVKWIYKKNNSDISYVTYRKNNGKEEKTYIGSLSGGGYEIELPTGKNWNGEWSEEIENTYYDYSDSVINCMFSNDNFWLASIYVNPNELGIGVALRCVSSGTTVKGWDFWNSQRKGDLSAYSRGVRPVVSLKSDVQLTRTGETGPWNISVSEN